MSDLQNSDTRSIGGLLRTINKKWTILAVVAVGNFGRVRFNQLRRELIGISPKTLIETLRDLERIGVVNSEKFLEIPPKVEYFLTPEGLDLRSSLMPLVTWMDGHAEGGRPQAMRNALSAKQEENTEL